MQELIGKKVTIHSESGTGERQDIGTIENFDGVVVKLKKENETLYFVIHKVRMIKIFA